MKYHGFYETKEHRVWRALKQRTNDKNHCSYTEETYTITKWEDFLTFYKDVGPVIPGKETLVRLDWRKPYGPSNCRWGTRKEARKLRKPDHRTKKTCTNSE